MGDFTEIVPGANVRPPPAILSAARESLIHELPAKGLGHDRTAELLKESISPALTGNSKSPNYYGFVTGGATPIARLADNIVTDYDNSCALPSQPDSITGEVEDAALKLLCQLLDFKDEEWKHRIFTTGATASNILGMALARQWVLQEAARRSGMTDRDIQNLADVGRVGLSKAMKFANIDEIQVLTTVPHSSLIKALSIVGLGRESIKLIHKPDAPHKFDLEALASALATPRTASIVAISCSEVNSGLFATTGAEMKTIRELCDKHGAWIHVDGAFGIMGRCLPKEEQYRAILEGCEGMELADSITGDCHKLLNVPYDCGFFLSKHPDAAFATFQNAGAVYLSAAASSIMPFMNIGIENSRRFRALPVYANLVSMGAEGFRDMLQRQVALTRRISALVRSYDGLEVLPPGIKEDEGFIVVMFRAKDDEFNKVLMEKINASRRIYVSGSQFEGKPSTRFAVSNWQVDVERDIRIIKEVLETVC